MAIDYPPIFINNYLAEKVSGVFQEELEDGQRFNLRFFPTSPTDIDALTQGFPAAENNVFAVYDRMFKMRRTPFPHIKCEQLLYYFYKMSGDPVALIKTSQLVQDLLDRGDESAQEINAWIKQKLQDSPGPLVRTPDPEFPSNRSRDKIVPTVQFSGENFFLPFFHEIKIYQLEETRDIIDFGTARTYAGNKIIIDYDWHSTASKA
jgi:hypothetical protein